MASTRSIPSQTPLNIREPRPTKVGHSIRQRANFGSFPLPPPCIFPANDPASFLLAPGFRHDCAHRRTLDLFYIRPAHLLARTSLRFVYARVDCQRCETPRCPGGYLPISTPCP